VRTVDWDEFPEICLELIDVVEATGATIEIAKDGRSVLRLIPVNEGNKALIETGS